MPQSSGQCKREEDKREKEEEEEKGGRRKERKKVQGVIEIHGECLNFSKSYSKRHVGLDPSQNLASHVLRPLFLPLSVGAVEVLFPENLCKR